MGFIPCPSFYFYQRHVPAAPATLRACAGAAAALAPGGAAGATAATLSSRAAEGGEDPRRRPTSPTATGFWRDGDDVEIRYVLESSILHILSCICICIYLYIHTVDYIEILLPY